MIASLRGPRGSTEVILVRRSMRAWPVMLACALLCFVVGCSRRAPGPKTDDLGVTEEGIGPGSDSSLDLAREGRTPGAGGVLQDVYFAFDSDELDQTARAVLEENLTWLGDNAATRLELEGHCDSRGTVEYNLALGARRARVVQEYLVGQGIGAERLGTISYGEELPVCRQETEECWARNRRVHFVTGKR